MIRWSIVAFALGMAIFSLVNGTPDLALIWGLLFTIVLILCLLPDHRGPSGGQLPPYKEEEGTTPEDLKRAAVRDRWAEHVKTCELCRRRDS
ncbi:hypothetical protein C6N75_09785 [Streptomyces solincola]|uniref:Uncharacterized protein n=1 Tax=Streptomyces solincola TaxID=2100817 RepID=A0A2S9PY78_9ACTN|nr:hypothetical protein [Streptomyces solincola]PRH79365.1 hypothetical protein C6N75_09785 [Streptomyces solincola]